MTFEEQIRAIVRDELARAQPASARSLYSSARGGVLPNGWSRRRFLERVRTLPEAHRVGGKRGRGVMWTITCAAWDASFAAPTKQDAAAGNVVSIDSLIANAGYRATKAAS